MVVRIGDIDVPRPVHRHIAGQVQLRLDRGAAVPAEAGHSSSCERGDGGLGDARNWRQRCRSERKQDCKQARKQSTLMNSHGDPQFSLHMIRAVAQALEHLLSGISILASRIAASICLTVSTWPTFTPSHSSGHRGTAALRLSVGPKLGTAGFSDDSSRPSLSVILNLRPIFACPQSISTPQATAEPQYGAPCVQTPRVSDGFLPVAARRGFWYT